MMAVRTGVFLASGAVGGFDMLFAFDDRDADGGIFCKTNLNRGLRIGT